MQYDTNKIKEYIELLDTIGKEYDFEYESASFFQIDKIKPELFIKNNIDEKDSLTIISALLDHDIMPDNYYDYTKDSLIELAIKNKCSIEFIKELIFLSGMYNLDIIGVASQSLKLMINSDYYSYDDTFNVISTFFEYGYNYLNDDEYANEILGYFRNSSKYTFLKLVKLVDYGKKGYKESVDKDLLTMYKYTAVNPKNIVKYLLPNIKENNDRSIELIRSFFKCNLDRTVKILSEISEITFEIPKNSKAYHGLKVLLEILFSNSEIIFPGVLYGLFCSLIIQKDINLLTDVLSYYKNCDFDFIYYGKAILDTAVDKLNEMDMQILKDKLRECGYREEDKAKIKKHKEQIDKNKTNFKIIDDREEQNKTNNLNEDFKNIGKVLNNINYTSMPGVGRDTELENVYLGLARRNGSVILVGESGVGKTEIINRLSWQLQNNKCPDFLKDRVIVEISLTSLIAGCMYRGSIEEKMKEVFNKTKKYNAIVVINEIHNIFGLGSSSEHNFDLSEMLKTEIEEGNIQVIGTTTKEEYEKYFVNSALKRRFKKVDVDELSEGLLVSVFAKVIEDLCNIYNIELDKSIDMVKLIDIIVKNTKYKCRKYNDRENNPSLGISIIEDAFAYVIVNNQNSITIDNFVEAFNAQDRIYDIVKERATYELEALKENKEMKRVKANIIDISYLKRNK